MANEISVGGIYRLIIIFYVYLPLFRNSAKNKMLF